MLLDPLGAEDAHQVVFEREVEARGAGIALAAGAAAELVVDAARLVALGAEDVQAAELRPPRSCSGSVTCSRLLQRRPAASSGAASGSTPFLLQHLLGEELGVAAEQDVGAAAGHVGGDGDRALAAGLGDDLRLALVVLGVEHVVRDPALLEQLRAAAPTSRSRSCRPAPAGPSRGAPRSRRRPRRTSRARSCRRRPLVLRTIGRLVGITTVTSSL